jgi:hypothetical protein
MGSGWQLWFVVTLLSSLLTRVFICAPMLANETAANLLAAFEPFFWSLPSLQAYKESGPLRHLNAGLACLPVDLVVACN